MQEDCKNIVKILPPGRIGEVEKGGSKWYINGDYENNTLTRYNILGEPPPVAFKNRGNTTASCLKRRKNENSLHHLLL
jgi:hypothetical protein